MVKIKIISIAILAIALMLFSCTKDKKLKPEQYIKWVNSTSNNLVMQKQVGNYNLMLKYLPVDFLVLKEFEKPYYNIDEKEFEENKKRFADHHYFTLRVTSKDNSKSVLNNDISGYEEYGNRLNYFAFDSQDDFKLVQENDTIDCALHHFENNYGLSQINDITLVFKDNNSKGNLTFFWKDRVLGIGTVKFLIERSELDIIPTLQIN